MAADHNSFANLIWQSAAPAAAYANYAAALPDLEQRLGRHCSYCERYIATNLAIEHVQPKSLVPALALTWSNFLLACVNCNSCKGDTPVTVADYLWPDSDNTLRAFEYRAGGVVAPHSTLAAPVRAFAGTCSNSFDASGNLQVRPRGQL